MGEEVVREQDGLRSLQVGVARQVDLAGFLSPLQQDLLEHDHVRPEGAQHALRVEPEVCGDLVVATPPSVETCPDVTGQLGHSAFDSRVDVLVAGSEDEAALDKLRFHLIKGCEQLLDLVVL